MLDRVAHDIDRGAADKRRQQLDPDAVGAGLDAAHDAEVDDRDRWNLRIVYVLQRGPHRGLERPLAELWRYHCAPSSSRATDVNSFHSQMNESSGCGRSRPSAGGVACGIWVKPTVASRAFASDRQLTASSDIGAASTPAETSRSSAGIGVKTVSTSCDSASRAATTSSRG